MELSSKEGKKRASGKVLHVEFTQKLKGKNGVHVTSRKRRLIWERTMVVPYVI